MNAEQIAAAKSAIAWLFFSRRHTNVCEGVFYDQSQLSKDQMKRVDMVWAELEALGALREVVPMLPDGLFLHDGHPHFHCRVCEAVTPFEGDNVMDFCLTDNGNVCGGSPRCCP